MCINLKGEKDSSDSSLTLSQRILKLKGEENNLDNTTNNKLSTHSTPITIDQRLTIRQDLFKLLQNFPDIVAFIDEITNSKQLHKIIKQNMISNNLKFDKKTDYTFDDVYFESIEKIGAFSLIINLKNAIKQKNEEEHTNCENILKEQNPQLHEFMLKNKTSFNKFFKLHNNALLTLKSSIDILQDLKDYKP